MKNKAPIKTLSALVDQELLSKDHVEELTEVIDNFALSITQTMLERIDKDNPNDPIAKQFIPSSLENIITAEELVDPIGDQPHTKVKGIIHRHPDRVLLTPVLLCPVYCRFCFRKEKIATEDSTLTSTELENAYEYIASHPEIWEVILTGGDPFILKAASLKKIMMRLNQISHLDIIRFHTRVPVVDPDRITTEFIHAIQNAKTTYVILHINHANEFSDKAQQACKKIIDAGIPMLSQTVLLKGINDNVEALSQLMRLLVKHRIKPYYLHHADLARGTSHFRTTIAEGQAIMKALRKRFSGLCQPTYVLDLPGGIGKIPM